MKRLRTICLALSAMVGLWGGPISAITTVNDSNTPASAVAGNENGNGVVDATLSPPARDVAKMAAGGVPEDVLKAFIDNSSSTFNLNSDAIIHLQSSGISGAVISEMLAHDKVLRDRAIALS